MKTAVMALLTLQIISLSAHAGPVFRSSVAGITIDNAHEVSAGTGKVYRGSEPLEKVHELINFGITNVIIFKKETKNEVTKEIAAFKANGFKKEQIKSIAFPWKDIKDPQFACNQAMEALIYLNNLEDRTGKKTYFHCTVGQDRTGLLAGLYRIWNQDWTAEQAFSDEMCLHGYAQGNPNKPYIVSSAITASLSPLYFRMASILAKTKASGKKLSLDLCQSIMKQKIASKLPTCSPSNLAE